VSEQDAIDRDNPYRAGVSAADAEWLAAIRAHESWDEGGHHIGQMLYELAYPEDPWRPPLCRYCVGLRALLKRAMDNQPHPRDGALRKT